MGGEKQTRIDQTASISISIPGTWETAPHLRKNFGKIERQHHATLRLKRPLGRARRFAPQPLKIHCLVDMKNGRLDTFSMEDPRICTRGGRVPRISLTSLLPWKMWNKRTDVTLTKNESETSKGTSRKSLHDCLVPLPLKNTIYISFMVDNDDNVECSTSINQVLKCHLFQTPKIGKKLC